MSAGADVRPASRRAGISRSAGAFKTPAAARTYWVLLAVLTAAAALAAFGLLAYASPFETGTHKWWLIAERRSNALIAMAVAAVCQAVATVAFQTVTNNRIITPVFWAFRPSTPRFTRQPSISPGQPD